MENNKIIEIEQNDKLEKDKIEYLKSLNEIQCNAYLIAKNHLETSFNIYKSNGFKEWQQQNKK